MKLDIQFVNFPKSSLFREIFSNRIQECFDKFSASATSVKVFFSVGGIEHRVKIAIKAKQMRTCINAVNVNLNYSIEKAIQKLESLLRRISARHKNLKKIIPSSNQNPETLHNGKRSRFKEENVFDKYEKFYASDFEYF